MFPLYLLILLFWRNITKLLAHFLLKSHLFRERYLSLSIRVWSVRVLSHTVKSVLIMSLNAPSAHCITLIKDAVHISNRKIKVVTASSKTGSVHRHSRRLAELQCNLLIYSCPSDWLQYLHVIAVLRDQFVLIPPCMMSFSFFKEACIHQLPRWIKTRVELPAFAKFN